MVISDFSQVLKSQTPRKLQRRSREARGRESRLRTRLLVPVPEAGACLLPGGVAVWAPAQRDWAGGAAGEAAPRPRPAPASADGMAGWSPVCCFPGLPPPGPLPGDGGFSYSFLGGLGAGLSASGSGVHEGAHRHAVLSPGPRPRACSPWFRAALSVCLRVCVASRPLPCPASAGPPGAS